MINDFLGKKEVFLNEREIANAKMERVIEALQNKDEAALKSLFSHKAIAELDSFDQSMVNLFDYYEGEFLSKFDWGGTSGDEIWENGNRQKIVYSSFDVKTSNTEYRFRIQDVIVDTADAENVGIHSMYVIKMEDDIDPRQGYRGDNKFTVGINIGVKNTLPVEIDD